jgi:DNA-binding transcriptional MerR regulator
VENLLLTHDVARMLGRTPATVRAWAKHGLLKPAATTPSGCRLFKRCDVERLLRQRKTRRPRVPPVGEAA